MGYIDYSKKTGGEFSIPEESYNEALYGRNSLGAFREKDNAISTAYGIGKEHNAVPTGEDNSYAAKIVNYMIDRGLTNPVGNWTIPTDSIPYVGSFVDRANAATLNILGDTATAIGADKTAKTLYKRGGELSAKHPYTAPADLVNRAKDGTLLDYALDENGMTAAMANLAGSQLAFAPASALMAATPLPALAGGLLGLGGKKLLTSVLGRATTGTAASNAISNLGVDVAGEAVANALAKAGATGLMWGAQGPVEALAEKGGAMNELREARAKGENNLTDEEIAERTNEQFIQNAFMLAGTNAIEGPLMRYGNIKGMPKFANPTSKWQKAVNKASDIMGYAPAGIANTALQGFEEGEQKAFENRALGKEYGYIPGVDWTDDQYEEAYQAIAGMAPLALARGVAGHVANRYSSGQADSIPNTTAQGNTDIPKAQSAPSSEAPDTPEPPQDVLSGLRDGFEQWKGHRMDNGSNGCVEAVTKIGEHYSPWLAKQKEQNVVYAPQLLRNAMNDGIEVIPFDPANLEAGDVIVYDKEGDEYDPNVPDSGNNHVVIYNGKGGYVGNSSSKMQVVESDSYELGGGLHPARIIKTGRGGTAFASNADTTATSNNDTAPDLSVDTSGVDNAAKQMESQLQEMANDNIDLSNPNEVVKLASEELSALAKEGDITGLANGTVAFQNNDTQALHQLAQAALARRQQAQSAPNVPAVEMKKMEIPKKEDRTAKDYLNYIQSLEGEQLGATLGMISTDRRGNPMFVDTPENRAAIDAMMQQEQGEDPTQRHSLQPVQTPTAQELNDTIAKAQQVAQAQSVPIVPQSQPVSTIAPQPQPQSVQPQAPANEVNQPAQVNQPPQNIIGNMPNVNGSLDAVNPEIQNGFEAAINNGAVEALAGNQQETKRNNVSTEALLNASSNLNKHLGKLIGQLEEEVKTTPYLSYALDKLRKDKYNLPYLAGIVSKGGNSTELINLLQAYGFSPYGNNATETRDRLLRKSAQEREKINKIFNKVRKCKNAINKIQEEYNKGKMSATKAINTINATVSSYERNLPSGKAADIRKYADYTIAEITNAEAKKTGAPQEQTAQSQQETEEKSNDPIVNKYVDMAYRNVSTHLNTVRLSDNPIGTPEYDARYGARTLEEAINKINKLHEEAKTVLAKEIKKVPNITEEQKKEIVEKALAKVNQKVKERIAQFKRNDEADKQAKKAETEEKAKEADEAEKKKTMSDFHGFGADKAPMTRGTIRKTLSKKFRYTQRLKDGSVDEEHPLTGIMTRAEFIERAEAMEGSFVKAGKDKNGKTEYTVTFPNKMVDDWKRTGPDITKAEYEYFQHLRKLRNDGAEGLLPLSNYTLEQSAPQDNKKAADESGKKLSPKDKVVEKLRAIKNTPITNKATGIVASFGVTGINKMTSNAAISKSQKNGFSRAEHLEAVSDIVSLFENAELTNIHSDKNNATNVLSIKRFTATIDKDKSALITVKESVVDGHHIYSLELEEIKKAPSERVGHNDMTYTDGALSADSSIQQNQQEVKGNSYGSNVIEIFGTDKLQRIEEPGVTASIDKPQGLYTSPANVESPHKNLGGEKTEYTINPKARVFMSDGNAKVMSNRRNVPIEVGSNVYAAIDILGKERVEQMMATPKKKLQTELTEQYSDVEWDRYYDQQEMVEAVGGIEARNAGYDATCSIDKDSPEFSEYVILTPNAIKEQIENSNAAQKQQDENKESIFGEYNEDELFEALGIEAVDETNDTIKMVDLVDDSAEAEAKLIADLKKKFNSVNAGFDPTIMVPAFKLGAIYLQRGINKFPAWKAKMIESVGGAITPWTKPVWDSLKSYPQDRAFNETHATMMFKSVGALYESGQTDIEAIKKRITRKMSKENAKRFDPIIESAYNGVKTYFDNMGADNDGRQQAESRSTAGGSESVQSEADKKTEKGEDKRSGLSGAVSGRSEGEGTGNTGSDEEQNTSRAGSDSVREGTELGKTDSKGDSTGGDKPAAQELTEAQKNPSPTETPGHDYEIKESAAGKTGEATRFKQNIAAIKMLKQLETEGRMPTPSEQEILAAYNGWGSLKNAFLDGTKENIELKELLTDDEYRAAEATINDAFYTSPGIVRAIWKGVSHLGFKGGRVLDPSMGVGNFYGCMPRGMMKKSSLQGVEIDNLTSRFAKMLYPSAHVENTGFQKAELANDFFDLVISNIPFGQLKIDGYKIHNYFFANGIDKVRPGGLMVFVTSQGSLTNSEDGARMRNYLDGKADMIAAYKLPEGTFAEAGTGVITDIVIFQKRGKDGTKSPYAQEFTELTMTDGVTVNDYFEKHPENVLGNVSVVRDQYYRPALSVKQREGESIADSLDKAMEKLPENIYAPQNRSKSKVFDATEANKKARADKKTRDLEYYIKNGKVVQNQGGEAVAITGKKADIVKAYVGIKNDLNALIIAQCDPKATDKQLSALRAQLNKSYDSFVKKFGYLTDTVIEKNYRDDPSAGMVMALERPIFAPTEYSINKNGQKVRKPRRVISIEKANIFTERTMQAISEVKTASTPADALLASLAQKGDVNLEYMAGLLKSTPEKVATSLKGQIFKNPVTEEYETRDEYLSGNVREKLAQAKTAAKADKSYQDNVDELTKVIPEDLVSDEIIVNMGAPWIPVSDIQDFVNSMADRGNVTVKFLPSAAKWIVGGWGNSSKFNFNRRLDMVKTLEHILNNKAIEINITDSDGKKYLDQNATDTANVTADEIRAAFKDWIWSDKAREKRLVRYYNDNYNNTVTREYDGSHLGENFPGMVSTWKMKPHQQNVVWRMLQKSNTLIAHCVGAGKTAEMQAAGMEMRRLGIAKKPLYCLPNNVVEQFTREFRQLYPNAKLLVLTTNDLPAVKSTSKRGKTEDGRIVTTKIDLKTLPAKEREKILKGRADRNRTLARIQTEDWDGIIISHTMFERLPLTPETTNSFIKEQIDILKRTKREGKAAKGEQFGKRALSILEDQIETLQNRMERILNTSLDDIGIPFEQLGIDQIFVDEADLFKNLHYATSMDRVSGLANSDANRSNDMFAKTQWLTRTLGGRGVVFATGTPISNTMAEMYTMLRYMDMQGLKEKGLDLFDNWIRTFAEIGSGIERKPSGDGFRKVNKVKNFINMADLIKMFRKVADVKTKDDLDLNIPKLKNDKNTVVTIKADPVITKYIKEVVPKRIDEMKNDPDHSDNMLVLTNDLRKLSLNNSKINACADQIVKKFAETEDVKGAQLVFCDMGIPKAEKENKKEDEESTDNEFEVADVKAYEDLKQALINKGVPENQIAFVHDAKNKAEQAELFQKVDSGELRILIGSTGKMGAGTNCQHHLVALHHLDAPWRPRDIEQREGRILRQGNQNEEVEIFNYVVQDSFDANMWEKLKNKAAIIAQAMSGDSTMRVVEDADLVTLSYAEVEGAATGNPLIKEQLNLNNEVTKYAHAQTSFKKKQRDAERDVEVLPAEIEQLKKTAEKIKTDIEGRTDTKGEAFSMKIGSTVYTERTKAEAALQKVLKGFIAKVSTKIGEIGGFDLKAMKTETGYSINGAEAESGVRLQLVNNYAYGVDTASVQGIENRLRKAPESSLNYTEKQIEEKGSQLKSANEVLKRENPYAEKLKNLQARLAEVNREIEKTLMEGGQKQEENSSPEDVKEDLTTGNQKTDREYFDEHVIVAGMPKDNAPTVSNSEKVEQDSDVLDDTNTRNIPPNLASYIKGVNKADVDNIPAARKRQIEDYINNPNLTAIETEKGGYAILGKGPRGAFTSPDRLTPAETVYYALNGGTDFNSGTTKQGIRNDLERWYGATFIDDDNPELEAPKSTGKQKNDTTDGLFDTSDFTHTKTGEQIVTAKLLPDLKEYWGIISSIAKSYGGSYNKFAKRFFFTKQSSKEANEQKRDTFVEKVKQMLQDKGVDVAKFSVSKGTPRANDVRSRAELKADIREAFPNARNIVETEDGLRMTLPNGTTVKLSVKEKIDVTGGEANRARAVHGIDGDIDITVNGYTLTGTKRAFIELAQDGIEGTAFHEVFHVAYDMALTDKEKQAIELAFRTKAREAGKDIVEYAADRYRDWKLHRKSVAGKFGKALDKVATAIRNLGKGVLGKMGVPVKFHDSVQDIFEGIASGEVWNRGAENNQENIENTLDNFLEKFDNVDKEYWESVGFDRDKQSSVLHDVLADMESVRDKIQKAKTHDELDNIRNNIKVIKQHGVWFNVAKDADGDYVAVRSRFAMEVFENEVAEARGRIDGQTSINYKRSRAFRGLDGTRDGLNSGTGRRVSRFEFASSGFRLSDKLSAIPANKHYVEELAKYRQEHPEEYTNKHYSADRSDNQGGFSNAESQRNENIKKQERGFFDKAVDTLARKIGLTKITDERIRITDGSKNTNYLSIFKNGLSSPGRLAEKYKAFAPFFQMGSKATEEVVRLRTMYNRKLDKILKVGRNELLKTEEEKTALFNVLWEGDIEGKVFTGDDFKALNYSGDMYKAYSRIRKLMHQAYVMVDEAKRHIQTFPPKDITNATYEKLRRNKFVEIVRATKNANGTWHVSWKGTSRWDPKNMEYWEKPVVVDKDAMELMKSDDCIQVVWGEELTNDDGSKIGMWRLYINEEIPPLHERKGYIPHFFHEYMIDVRDKDGKLVEGVQVSIRSARTQKEAVAIAEEWLKTHDLEKGQEIFIRPKMFDFSTLGMNEESAAAVMGMGEYRSMLGKIAASNSISFKEAKEIVGGSVRLNSRHRFFGNMLQRKGVEGYEENLDWVLRHYFNMASRYSALESIFKPNAVNLFERLYGDISKEYTGVAEYTKDYINDINGKPSTLEQNINEWFMNSDSMVAKFWRKHIASAYGERAALQFMSHTVTPVSYLTLGCLNISSALLNLTQIMNSAAYIGDVSALFKVLYNGFSLRGYKYSEMKILMETGVLNDIGLDSVSGYDINRGHSGFTVGSALGKVKRGVDWAGDKGMFLFKHTESLVRRGTVIAAYNKARADGKSHREAIEFAREVNRKSNFDYGVADAPNIFRRGSIISQLALQFKKYPIKELEVMGDMLPFISDKTSTKQKAIFWATYILACGLMGIPFIDWPDDLLADNAGIHLKEGLQKLFMEWAGDSPVAKEVVGVGLYGLASIANINISGRAGLSDVIPSRPSDWLGAMPNKAYNFTKDVLAQDWLKAIRDISPGLYNILAATVIGESTGRRGRVNDRYEDTWQRIVRGMGFRSIDETVTSTVDSIIKHEKKSAQTEQQNAIDNYLKAEEDGASSQKMAEYARKLKELGISPKRVKEERKKKKQDRMERLTDGMKKEEKQKYKDLLNFAK